MRCLICGRAIAGTEPRLAKETMDCQGCQDEFKVACAVLNPDGTRAYTNEQAMALARNNHYQRERAIFDATRLKTAVQVAAAGKKIADDWAEALK